MLKVKLKVLTAGVLFFMGGQFVQAQQNKDEAKEKEIADLVEVYLKNENYNVFKFYDSK